MSLWVGARELSIAWVQEDRYWKWISLPDSESDLAELLEVCWLDIRCTIDVRKLLLKTSYSVFLVFKLREKTFGLKRAMASVRFVNEKADAGSSIFIDKKRVPGERGRFPQPRGHGWMEIKLGEFFNNLGEDGDVEVRLFETKELNWKSGLIIKGFEIRPNY